MAINNGKKAKPQEKGEADLKRNPPEMDGVKDMTSLLYLEEPNVIHNLKCRFLKNSVYTEIGSILLSMNPYEWIKGLYGDAAIKKYSESKNVEVLDPHCYKISTRALEAIKRTNKSQSILICGESGSGKTESSKACIDLLVISRKNPKHKGLAKQIIAINPLLEALGNAKTTRNNNSSRFGKFTKVLLTEFDRNNPAGSLVTTGCRIESYLLEKSRVVSHEPIERTFHVFYFVFHSKNPRLGLSRPEDYRYIAATTAHRAHIQLDDSSDAKRYAQMRDSLGTLGMSNALRDGLEELVAAVLHLGNVDFEEDGKGFCRIAKGGRSPGAVAKAAELAGVTEEQLRRRLTSRKIKVGMEVIESPLSVDEAEVNRNAIAKSVYSIVFDWAFQEVNEFFDVEKSDKRMLNIGILDIFGNSFEQFCINYANETLQQLFSESLMIAEQNEYIKEGVFWIPLEIPNNDEIISLCSGPKSGIFTLLEAACNMPKGTSSIFVSNVMQNHRRNKKLKNVKMSKELNATLTPNEKFNGFLVHHFADDVIYNCNEFLDKNKDLVSDETTELLKTSSAPVFI